MTRLFLCAILPASVLIAFTALLRRAFLRRLPVGLFTVLWLMAAVRLLLPFSLPISGLSAAPSPAARVYEAAAAAPQALVQAVGAREPAAAQVLLRGFAVLWAVGTAALAGAFLLGHYRCARRYRQALPAQEPAIDGIVRRFGLRRHVSVRVCQQIASPLTYGLFRPVILLPKHLEHAPAAELAHILTHELVHIRRLHVLYKYLMAAALCLHWVDPLVWVMYVLSGRDLEMGCDAAAVALLDGQRADYAATLLRLEREKSLTPALGFGAPPIRQRLEMLARHKKAGLAPLLLAGALILGATGVFASSPVAAEEDPVPADTPTPEPAVTAAIEVTPAPISVEVEPITLPYVTAPPAEEEIVAVLITPTPLPAEAVYVPLPYFTAPPAEEEIVMAEPTPAPLPAEAELLPTAEGSYLLISGGAEPLPGPTP